MKIKNKVKQFLLIKYLIVLKKIRNNMSSPLRAQINLENEIKKRINQNDLTKNDLDFYQRKLRRLQNQNNITQDELSKLKVKFRRAQDYQLKYELLFKQSTDLKNDLHAKNHQLNDLQSINEQLKANLEEKASKDEDFTHERANLYIEVAKWKDKFQQAIQKNKNNLQDQRIRCQQTIKHEKDRLKRQHLQREQDYQSQIRQLKKLIQQKQIVQDIISGRVEKIRNQKDDEINRLKSIIHKKTQSYEQYMKEKDQQLQRMKQKFQKMINFDIQNLKHNLDDQQEIFRIELDGLRQMIGLKNDQIQKLLAQIKRQAKQHEIIRRQLQKQISLLKQKIYTIEKQSQIQIMNLKDRLITIHKQDINSIEDKHQKINDSLKDQIQNSRRFIKELERIRQNQKKQFQRMKNQLNDRLKQKDNRIHQMGANLMQRGSLNAQEMKNLHESFHKIQSQKQILTHDYQANITFLNQQLGKSNTANEIKAGEIKKLIQQIHALKLSYEDRLNEIDKKNRKQRKQRQDQRQQQRIHKQKLKETMEDMARQFKNVQRKLQREKQKLQREKNKIQYMLEQAENDIKRLNQYIKQIDQNLKQQFKKAQVSTLDQDSLRRNILTELERQKIDLQALNLMQIDQAKKKYEVQFGRLTTQNQQLQTELLTKSIAFQKMQNQFKKLDYKHRNADKLQRDKIKEYQTKMMTLNQQINITQKLYKTFLDAKARAER